MKKAIAKHSRSPRGLMYFTSDNLSFFNQQQAYNHAATLADSSVVSMNKAEANTAADCLLQGYGNSANDLEFY